MWMTLPFLLPLGLPWLKCLLWWRNLVPVTIFTFLVMLTHSCQRPNASILVVTAAAIPLLLCCSVVNSCHGFRMQCTLVTLFTNRCQLIRTSRKGGQCSYQEVWKFGTNLALPPLLKCLRQCKCSAVMPMAHPSGAWTQMQQPLSTRLGQAA